MEFDLLHVHDGVFCGNLIYIIKKFSNHFYIDNDHNSYTFGIWAPICLKSANYYVEKMVFKVQ